MKIISLPPFLQRQVDQHENPSVLPVTWITLWGRQYYMTHLLYRFVAACMETLPAAAAAKREELYERGDNVYARQRSPAQ